MSALPAHAARTAAGATTSSYTCTVHTPFRTSIHAAGLACLASALVASPAARAIDVLSHHVFVSSPQSMEVAVIETDRDEVIGGFSLANPPDELVVSENERLLIARAKAARVLETVELDTLRRGARLSLAPAVPRLMRLDADGRLLAVTDEARDELMLIELPGLSVRHHVRVHRASHMTFDRDGTRLFVASLDGREVAVIDVAGGDVREIIELGADGSPGAVTGFARTPGGELGFVLHGRNGLISVIDVKARRFLRTITLQMNVARAYPTMNSQYVMVPDRDSDALSLVSTWTFAESWRVDVARDVVDVDTAFFDSLAFVQSAAEAKTVVLRLDDRRRVGEIALPAAPSDAIASSNGLKLYVALPALSRVVVIDTASVSVSGSIDVAGVAPVTLSAVSDRSYCH